MGRGVIINAAGADVRVTRMARLLHIEPLVVLLNPEKPARLIPGCPLTASMSCRLRSPTTSALAPLRRWMSACSWRVVSTAGPWRLPPWSRANLESSAQDDVVCAHPRSDLQRQVPGSGTAPGNRLGAGTLLALNAQTAQQRWRARRCVIPGILPTRRQGWE